MARPIERLRKWAEDNNGNLAFHERGGSGQDRWVVEAHMDYPLKFDFGQTGPTVDDAAAKVLERLSDIGEEIPQ